MRQKEMVIVLKQAREIMFLLQTSVDGLIERKGLGRRVKVTARVKVYGARVQEWRGIEKKWCGTVTCFNKCEIWCHFV